MDTQQVAVDYRNGRLPLILIGILLLVEVVDVVSGYWLPAKPVVIDNTKIVQEVVTDHSNRVQARLTERDKAVQKLQVENSALTLQLERVSTRLAEASTHLELLAVELGKAQTKRDNDSKQWLLDAIRDDREEYRYILREKVSVLSPCPWCGRRSDGPGN